MLNVPNLDDQRFEETLESAILQIPYLYPEWTDFNEHDPGITLLELFIWYKQMQQYQLNCLTDRNMEAFYKLLGLRRLDVRASKAITAVTGEQALPAGTPLYSDAGVPFRLQRGMCGRPAMVQKLYSKRSDGVFDITDLVGDGGAAFPVFGQPGRKSYDSLLIGLDMVSGTATVRLWVSVWDEYPVPRNPFDDTAKDPRSISFTAVTEAGEQPLTVLQDDTRGFSRSGRLIISAPTAFQKTDGGEGLPQLCWIQCSLTDAGCEEMPQLIGITADFAEVEQVQTLSEAHGFTVEAAGEFTATLDTYLAMHGEVWALVRDADGWYKARVATEPVEGGVRVTVRMPKKAAYDGGENLRLCCTDPVYYSALCISASGVPGEHIQLPTLEGSPYPEGMLVLCGSPNAKGELRYEDWTYIDALYHADCRDRRFTIDHDNDELLFGDGSWGRVIPGGKNSVLVAAVSYSQGAMGSAVTGTALFTTDQTDTQEYAPVCTVMQYIPGRDRESIAGMDERMKKMLATQVKAVTAGDYEQLAMKTPGIRIRQAKALPLFDPDKKYGQSSRAHVTMVVVPASGERFPSPDERFITAVRQQMERYRSICTCMHVIGPTYMGVTVWAEILADKNEQEVEAGIREALDAFFQKGKGGALGMPLKKTDVSEVLADCPGVAGLLQTELKGTGAGVSVTEQGDLRLPPNAIAYLKNAELHITRV